MTAQPYKVWFIRSDGATLDVSDGTNYSTDLPGLHDGGNRDLKLSTGTGSGSRIAGATLQPRQFIANVTIEAGLGAGYQIRNAAHNAARDALLRFLPVDETITIRNQYVGTAGYWEIEAAAQQIQWQPDTPTYQITFQAGNAVLVNTVLHTSTVTIDTLHQVKTLSLAVGGNQPTPPVIRFRPNLPKTDRWNFQRLYTVTNTANRDLAGYAVAVPFDFTWHTLNGRIRSDAGDLRVIAGGVFVDFWYGNYMLSSGLIWCELDLPALDSIDVQVVYGNLDAGIYPWANTRPGPIFDKDGSTNARWRYAGGFCDVPGAPSGKSQQWAGYVAAAQGFTPVLRHLGSPWDVSGGASPVNGAGGEMPINGNLQGYAGLELRHQLGFTDINVHGWTQIDPTICKFVIRTYDAVAATYADIYQQPATSTRSSLTEFTSGLLTFGAVADGVALTLRSTSVHSETAGAIGAGDRVSLTIASPPTVTGAGSGTSNESAIYMLEATVNNLTTGQGITLFGIITAVSPGVWNVAEVNTDIDIQSVEMGVDDFFYAFSQQPPIRTDWLPLRPGVTNVIQVTDVAADSTDVTVEWQDRRL